MAAGHLARLFTTSSLMMIVIATWHLNGTSMHIPDWFKRHILPDSWDKPARDTGSGGRILVVEDKSHIGRLVEVNLKRQGYCVDSADSGDDAFDSLLTDAYKLIILSSSLPDITFADMLSTLKADPDTEHIPVICLLSNREEINTFNVWRSGLDCYLTKPFNPMELIAFTRRVFGTLEEDADPGWRDHF